MPDIFDEIDEAPKDVFDEITPLPKVELTPYEKLRLQGVGPGLTATAGPIGTPEEAADIYASLVQPAIPIPRIHAKSTLGQIAAAPVNVAAGLAENIESPVGALSLPLFGGPVGRAAFAALGTVQGLKQLATAPTPGEAAEGAIMAAVSPLIAKRTSLEQLVKEKGLANARSIEEAAKVYGDVRPQPVESTRQVPAEEGGARVQPQAQAVAQTVPLPLRPETEPLPEAQPKAPQTIQQAWQMFDDTGEIDTVSDLANAVEGLIGEGNAPAYLTRALEKYRRAVEEDFRQYAGRGDIDTYEEQFTSAVERASKSKPRKQKIPTATETTPPVTELPTTPTATGLRPAIRLVGGEVVVGDAGKTHPDIISENKLSATDIDQRGFVDQQGNFLDREQAAVKTGLPTEKEPERLHSTDLPESQVELRHAGIPIPGSEKFVEEDIKPFAKEAAAAIGETASQVKSLLSPPSMGPEAKLGAGIIRERKAELARTDEQMRAKFDQNRKAMDKLTPVQSLDFINRMEHGLTQSTPELNTLQKSLRDEFDTRVSQVQAVNKNALQHLIQDYFPHLWKDPDSAISWYARILGRRPLRGPASFLKRRSIPTTAEGVNAGLEPVSWNPIDLSLLKFHEMDRYVMGQKIFQEFKDKGLAKFSRSDIAPEGYARINDRVANVIEYRPTTKASGLPGAPERVLRGHWYVQEDAARVLNNFLSPGLERFKWYRALRWFGNTMNMAQLGLSGYHFNFTMIDSGTSKLSLGIEQAAQGKPKSLLTMGRGVGGTVLANQLEAYLKGNRVLEEYTKPGSVGGDYAKVVDALIAGGGRVKMPEIFTNSTMKNFFKALRSGNYPGAVVRAPFAAIEAVSYPLMQVVVPRLKLGVFTDMALNEIERMGPNVTKDEFRATMGKVWDSVDNRMGEMVYDNLFWNKTLKDLSFLAVRAVGWNLGTLRELGGGVVDSTTIVNRIRAGDPVVTRRMAYLVSLPITVGMMGAMYQYLKTGKGPEEPRDYIYPKTGKILPDGTPERVSFPSYLKDIGSYSRHPLTTLANKLHPTWSTLNQMFQNKDYYGTQIRNPDDPLVKQVQEELEFIGRTFLPFSFRGAQRRVEGKESMEVKAESFFGMMPIPAEVARTTAQNKIMNYGIARMPQGARTPEEQQRMELKRDLESQLQSPADYQGAQVKIRQMAREGKLSKGQAAYENSKLRFEHDQIRAGKTKAQAQWLWRFKHLNLNEARSVYEVGTPEEKQLFFRELRNKELKAR